MAGLPERILYGTTAAIVWTPFIGACGYFGGLAYAKFSDYPQSQVAQNWAIYAVASNAIRNLALAFTENERVKSFLNAALIGVTGGFFITEMRKRDLMGDKLKVCFIAIHLFAILALLDNALKVE